MLFLWAELDRWLVDQVSAGLARVAQDPYACAQRLVWLQRLIGYGRRQNKVQRAVVVAFDQSGSMAQSVVYASIFGAVMASMSALRTSR